MAKAQLLSWRVVLEDSLATGRNIFTLATCQVVQMNPAGSTLSNAKSTTLLAKLCDIYPLAVFLVLDWAHAYDGCRCRSKMLVCCSMLAAGFREALTRKHNGERRARYTLTMSPR